MVEHMSIRMTPGNPDHHIWLNNGTWFIHYTVHLPDHTKRRIRRSLGTHACKEARRRRDRLLRNQVGLPCRSLARKQVAA